MRLLPLLALLILAQAASAQQTSEWLRMLENPKHSSDRLRPVNQISKYSKFDFSKLLVPRSEFLGFIEPNYQRLKIYYDSVTRSKKDPNIYLVKGASIVRGNRCDFSGSIKVTQIREYRSLHYGVDDEHKDKGIKNQGVIIATFRFEEDPTQAHVGIFEGVMTLNWYSTRDGRIQYDDIQFESDRYRNNQYVSAWTQYGSKKGKVANWGEYRIPFSGDLDIGAGEFSVNSKYLENGWRDLD